MNTAFMCTVQYTVCVNTVIKCAEYTDNTCANCVFLELSSFVWKLACKSPNWT
jgi:hypothetical protein